VVAGLYRLPSGHVTALVTPQFVGPESPLYAVEREFNGVMIEAAFAGPQFLRGRGAGGHPTGSAVLADVLALRRGFRYGYAKQATAPTTQLTHGLEIDAYVRHADAGVLREVLTWLELSPDALQTDVHGAYATGTVALQQLWAWRKELRSAGVFVARRGEVRATTTAVAGAASVTELA
jgi:homoserine dehydrogenase